MSGRVLVPWKSVSDELDDLSGTGLVVEVFTGAERAPDDLDDVVTSLRGG